MTTNYLLSLVCLHLLFIGVSSQCSQTYVSGAGSWQFLQKRAGVSAMHMQLLNNDHVILFDRTAAGPSNISLPETKCPLNATVPVDCTAHSVDYDVINNTVRPVLVETNFWCSSGAVSPDGVLIQAGGSGDGEQRIRTFQPCDNDCDWVEIPNGLDEPRWYATSHILPDGRQIIVGGRGQFNYEFYPKDSNSMVYDLQFLNETTEPLAENNLYPSCFLNQNQTVFIFANTLAILLNYVTNKVVKTYPAIMDGNPRSYPSTGSAVLLPLRNGHSPYADAEVLVCGGAPRRAFIRANHANFVGDLDNCGRIRINDPNPKWVMETMPLPRVMGDMVLLPNGNVLIINGAANGTAAWELGRNPVLNPVLYRPNNPLGSRFKLQNPATRPRMYHSTAILLRDGRVLVGGNNPHQYYNFTGVLYLTDLSLQAFYPAYLDYKYFISRPRIVCPTSHSTFRYSESMTIRFWLLSLNESTVSVTMVAPSLNTHSISMNQKLIVLGCEDAIQVRNHTYEVVVTMPGSSEVAPPGYYMIHVVQMDIPSEGMWVKIQ